MSGATAGNMAGGTILVRDLGRMSYADALAVQREVHEWVLTGTDPGTLLLVEHDPVITVSQRAGAAGHVLWPPERLARYGIDVQATDRGGDVTYHGPGQLVAYPILRLTDWGLNLGRYMRLLEEVVIAALEALGVRGQRIPGFTGVWVAQPGITVDNPARTVEPATHGLAKIAALGVRIRGNVSMHGLALNVTTDLDHFRAIVPCGLPGADVTSLRQLLGSTCPDMPTVKAAMARALQEQLGKAASSGG